MVKASIAAGGQSVTESILVTYAFDAYCGWCWGFSPTLLEFAAMNRDRIRLRVLSGGLFIGEGARLVVTIDDGCGLEQVVGIGIGDGHAIAVGIDGNTLRSIEARKGGDDVTLCIVIEDEDAIVAGICNVESAKTIGSEAVWIADRRG